MMIGQLLGRDLDNDAADETSAITGSIALDKSGAVVRGASGFNVNMIGLTSDETRRDSYVRTFQLLGDLTVKRVTQPTTWNVTATVAGDQLTGTAATAFTFAQFQLTQPKVRVVLSVNDTIRLEYDSP